MNCTITKEEIFGVSGSDKVIILSFIIFKVCLFNVVGDVRDDGALDGDVRGDDALDGDVRGDGALDGDVRGALDGDVRGDDGLDGDLGRGDSGIFSSSGNSFFDLIFGRSLKIDVPGGNWIGNCP